MHFFKILWPHCFLKLLISYLKTSWYFQNVLFLPLKMHFWILKKSKNFEKIYFSSFQGKNIFFKDFFNVILPLIPGLLYKSVVPFLLNALTKPWEGGKKSKKGPKGHFLPPCKFFIIAFSKKVKTLLYSKLGIRSKIKLKKLSTTFFSPRKSKIFIFRQLRVFF